MKNTQWTTLMFKCFLQINIENSTKVERWQRLPIFYLNLSKDKIVFLTPPLLSL
jgi:hypothetical protein